MNQISTQVADVWAPATETDKLQALASLGGLPSRPTLSAELDEATFFVALDGVTRHGLSEAVKFILRGALGHAFFPSPPELRLQYDKCMAHHKDTRARAQRREQEAADRPTITEPTEAQRERVRALYADFCKGYEKAAAEDTLRLDPALVAQIPDNPSALIHQRKGAA